MKLMVELIIVKKMIKLISEPSSTFDTKNNHLKNKMYLNI